MSAEQQIMNRIRRRLGRTDPDGALRPDGVPDPVLARVKERLSRPPRGIRPARVDCDAAGLQELFCTMLTVASADHHLLAHTGDAPTVVADYLRQRNLPLRLHLSGEEAITAIPWHENPALEVITDGEGAAREAAPVAVTGAFAGIAETGTLALLSGATRPTGLNFLPTAHIVLLPRAQIRATYEDMWADLRRSADGDHFMPRMVNLITGPSRTGDVDQTIELGAHGPQSLFVLLV